MKKLLPALIIISALFAFTACGNKDIIDTVYTYDYALVEMPGGEVVKLDIKKWRDYSDGEQLQIITPDGTVYLVSSINCVLVKQSSD